MEAVVYQYGNAVGAMSDVTVERIDGVTRVSGTWIGLFPYPKVSHQVSAWTIRLCDGREVTGAWAEQMFGSRLQPSLVLVAR